MYCGACGTEIPPGGAFCVQCGIKVTDIHSPIDAQPARIATNPKLKAEPNKAYALGCLILIGVLVGVGLLCSLFGQDSSDTAPINGMNGPSSACIYASKASQAFDSALGSLQSAKNHLDNPSAVQADIDRLNTSFQSFTAQSPSEGGGTMKSEVEAAMFSAVAYLIDLRDGGVGEVFAMAYLGNANSAADSITRFKAIHSCP